MASVHQGSYPDRSHGEENHAYIIVRFAGWLSDCSGSCCDHGDEDNDDNHDHNYDDEDHDDDDDDDDKKSL